ncbi:PTS transporter subunit IIC [Bifidobacterium aquikefiri]|uniref:PTS transporter subunit IIC n=1 Tax=Bifidobacterium aquikefiri TaxID=1653207 RepID=UPI0023F017DA|nr:PTS transporter subunit IIC [Bifidobacterium aquikefiri]
MSVFTNILDFISNNILQDPPILLGLIAMVGLIVQRKSIADIIKGSISAAFGMVILTEGVNMLTGVVAAINTAVQTKMGVGVSEGLSDVTFTSHYGGTVGIAMFLALIIHIFIARFTPVKTIFLTGHMAVVGTIRNCGRRSRGRATGSSAHCGECHTFGRVLLHCTLGHA